MADTTSDESGQQFPEALWIVKFTPKASRAMGGIPPRVVPAIVEFCFGDLARRPRRVGKPLGGELAGLHGARRGPYRVLYRIEDQSQTVFVVDVKHRSDAYRT